MFHCFSSLDLPAPVDQLVYSIVHSMPLENADTFGIALDAPHSPYIIRPLLPPLPCFRESRGVGDTIPDFAQQTGSDVDAGFSSSSPPTCWRLTHEAYKKRYYRDPSYISASILSIDGTNQIIPTLDII